ncbi:Fc.00g002460.m01.CDS01 [Cosmosporella sp. VM-42]
MAAPGFGFSAGDFVAALRLIVDVSKALKDTGGAADEYRQVLVELQLLQKVIQLLQSRAGPQPNASDPFSAYAKQQTDLTLQSLADFLQFVSKFDAKLGVQAQSGWFRGAGRKAQWAVVQAREVEKLRTRVGGQLQLLNLLVQLQDQPIMLHNKVEKVQSSLDGQHSDTATMRNEFSVGVSNITKAIEGLQASQITNLTNHSQETAKALEMQGKSIDRLRGYTANAIQTGVEDQTQELKMLTRETLQNRKLLVRGLESCSQIQREFSEALARGRDPILKAITDSHISLSKSIERVEEVVKSPERMPHLGPQTFSIPHGVARRPSEALPQANSDMGRELDRIGDLDETLELFVKL